MFFELWSFVYGFTASSAIWAIALMMNRRSRYPKTLRTCVCGHGNHVHKDYGRGECMRGFGVSEAFPNGSSCACKFFIEAPKKEDEATKALEKMVGL